MAIMEKPLQDNFFTSIWVACTNKNSFDISIGLRSNEKFMKNLTFQQFSPSQ